MIDANKIPSMCKSWSLDIVRFTDYKADTMFCALIQLLHWVWETSGLDKNCLEAIMCYNESCHGLQLNRFSKNNL